MGGVPLDKRATEKFHHLSHALRKEGREGGREEGYQGRKEERISRKEGKDGRKDIKGRNKKGKEGSTHAERWNIYSRHTHL